MECLACGGSFKKSNAHRKYCSLECMRPMTKRENELRRTLGTQAKRILLNIFAGDAFYVDFLEAMTPAKLLKFLLMKNAPEELVTPVSPLLSTARRSYQQEN